MSFQLFSTIRVKLVYAKMQNAHLCVILLVKHKKYHLSRLHRAPCPNISENSGKHFILQGRRLTETDKINKSLMLPAAKIASQ